jgi:hypothetical protein
MSAIEALKAARAVGIELELEGDDLLLEAATAPPGPILDLLRHHKAGVVALQRSGHNAWCAEEWQVFFDERAAIAEFDGRLSRTEAEASAFAHCAAEWLSRNVVCSSPDRCLACGSNRSHDQQQSDGFGPDGHPRSHARHWTVGDGRHKATAIAALQVMGIAAAASFPDDFDKPGAR